MILTALFVHAAGAPADSGWSLLCDPNTPAAKQREKIQELVLSNGENGKYDELRRFTQPIERRKFHIPTEKPKQPTPAQRKKAASKDDEVVEKAVKQYKKTTRKKPKPKRPKNPNNFSHRKTQGGLSRFTHFRGNPFFLTPRHRHISLHAGSSSAWGRLFFGYRII